MTEKVQINDRLEDLEVKYIYVRDWKWTDPLDAEKYQGAPAQRSVYRAVYNKKTTTYRVELSKQPFMGLFLAALNSGDDTNGYVSNVDVIDKSNILDLRLGETDLDKIVGWTESKNADLLTPTHSTQPQQPQFNPLVVVNAAMAEQAREDEQRIHNAIEAFNSLLEVNGIHFDIMVELINKAVDQNLSDHDSLTAVLSESPDGMGLNIGETLHALNRYVGGNRRTNQDREDLHKAFLGVLKELARRDINELDAE